MSMPICSYFTRNACLRGKACSFSHQPHPNSSTTPALVQDTQASTLCHHFQRGACRYGDRCSFLHAEAGNSWETYQAGNLFSRNDGITDSSVISSVIPATITVSRKHKPCNFFAQGRCVKGNECQFGHANLGIPVDARPSDSHCVVPTPVLDAGMSKDKAAQGEPCKFFDKGICKRGNMCQFLHLPPEAGSSRLPSDERDTSPEGDQHIQSQSPGCEPCTCPTMDDDASKDPCAYHRSSVEHPASVGREALAVLPDMSQTEHVLVQEDGEAAAISTARTLTLSSATPAFEPCGFSTLGWCTKGASCLLHHVQSEVNAVVDLPVTAAESPREANRWQGEGGEADLNPPVHPMVTPCKFFRQGRCIQGSLCQFQHEDDAPGAVPTPYWDNHHPSSSADLSISLCKFFAQGRCAKGDACKFQHFLVENECPTEFHDLQMGPWATEEHQGGYEGGWGGSLKRPTFGICKFFQQGICRKGEECTFRHDPYDTTEFDETPLQEGWPEQTEESRAGSWADRPLPPCKYFLAQGMCRKGALCNFRHDVGGAQESAGPSSFETRTDVGEVGWWNAGEDNNHGQSGAPYGPASRTCRYFSQGNGREGDACTFRHETTEPEETDEWGSQAAYSEDGWGAGDVDDNRWDPPPVSMSESRPCKYFSQGNCKNAEACPFLHDNTADDETSDQPKSQDASAEGGWAQENDDEGTPCPNDDEATWSTPWSNADVEPTTPRRVSAPCIYFGQGHCHNGDFCRYLHVTPPDLALDSGADNTSQDNEERRQADTTSELSELPAGPVIVKSHEPSFIDRSMFHCTVRFGAGATPQQITTAFESRHIILSNLPPHVTDGDIIEITEAFGDLITVHFDMLPTKANAHVEFAECAQAASAVQNLNNTEYQSMKLAARLDLRAAIESGTGTLLSRKVKISWYTPSLVAWAHYPTITKAKNEAIRLDGMTFDERKIKAAFQTPRRNQTHSFPVVIKGLPLDTNSISLRRLCVGASSTSIGEPNYHHSPVDDIRDLLAQFGSLDAFDVLPADRSKTKMTAFAQFDTGEAALAASKTLNGNKQDFLGRTSLWIQQIFSVKYNVGTRQFEAVKAALDKLRDAHNDCKIRYYDHADPVCIRIYGQEPRTMGHAKVELERLLRGETLICDGKDVWDEYFDTPSSQKSLQRINADNTFFVKCDSRNRAIRLFGIEADRERARALILRLLKRVQAQRHILPLKKDLLYALLNGGLKALHDEFGSTKVTLDIVSRTLTVRGEMDVVDRVRRAVTPMASPLASASFSQDADVLCPVCYCEAADPIKLSCGHVYCTTCLRHFLRSAIGPNFIQLKCVAEELDEGTDKNMPCPTEIPYHIIRDILPTTEEKDLLQSSFLSYIHTRPAEFHYCPTPDCGVVYRPGGQGTVLQCPSCLARICAACHVEFHEGLTCAEHSDMLTGGHEALDRWRKENGVKPCPNCQADLEKDGGCNHIQCTRCNTHLCWVCMKTFIHSGSVYDHMNKEHGGIGIIEGL